ncbi:MAG: hypothetical protein U1F23_04555 [Lysobacterales bacterium]
MSDPNPQSDDNGPDRNVEQIRDILFGGQMRDYERRFEALNQRLEAELKRLAGVTEQRVAELGKRLDEQLDRLGRTLHQESQERNRAVDAAETRLQQAARVARDEVGTTIEALRHEQSDAAERARAALAELRTAFEARAGEIHSDLERTRERLHGDKVGRQDLAEMLTELALRLKGEFDLPAKD